MRNRVQRAYNIAELRKLAKKRLLAPMFHYIDGGIRRIFRSEFERDMALIGAASLSDVTEQMLQRVGDGWPT